jgi:hypothetical protein
MGHEIVPAPHLVVPPAVTDVDVVAAFLPGRNSRTLKAYSFDVGDFAKLLGSPTPAAAVDLLLTETVGAANAIALGYRIDMAGRGLATATIAHRPAALRSVVKLARTLGRITWVRVIPWCLNPCGFVPRATPARRPKSLAIRATLPASSRVDRSARGYNAATGTRSGARLRDIRRCAQAQPPGGVKTLMLLVGPKEAFFWCSALWIRVKINGGSGKVTPPGGRDSKTPGSQST